MAKDFAQLRDALETNLRTGDDKGAMVAVYRHGALVADLWGGVSQDGRTPYPRDALQVVFSVSKALLGLMVTAMLDDGLIALGHPVARYWPEFAAGGKELVTLGELLAHQAGLPAFATPMTPGGLADWQRCVDDLAGQTPLWKPGSAHGYHALTMGYLAGEIIRRVTGHTPGDYLRTRFAEPLEAEVWIGLPPALGHRVERHVVADPAPGIGEVRRVRQADPAAITHRVLTNPEITFPVFDTPPMWGPEIPGANAIGDARSLARLMATAVDGPLRSLSPEAVAVATAQQGYGPDLVLVDQPSRFGTLFMLASPREPMLGTRCFGHNGAAGALAFADPESGISFAYVGNRAHPDPTPHRRIHRLLSAVRDAL
ncbi:serine hydrolase domain-containing protein [Streptomyces sp. NPDC001492]